MKTLFCVIAAASLSGCAVYPAGPAYETYGAPAGPVYPYVAQQPIYIQGGAVYRSNNVPHPHPYAYPRGYNRVHPDVIQAPLPRPHAQVPHPGAIHAPLPRPHVQAPHPGRGMRDRDGDGIPNRFDHDRNRDRNNDDGRSAWDRRHNQNDHR